MRKKVISAIIIIAMVFTLVPGLTVNVDASTSSYTINVNQRYTNQYRKDGDHILKYKFTISKSGSVTPVMYVDAERNYNIIGWSDGIYDQSLQTCYSTFDREEKYEDDNGHEWIICYFERCRLPAGTYYFYMGKPSSGLQEYGYFDLYLKYKDESSNSAIEKEFNDSRNTAYPVSCNKYYYGVNHKSDKDYFKFQLKSKTNIALYLYTDSGSYGMDFQPCVVNSSGTKVCNYKHIDKVELSNGIEYERYLFSGNLAAGTYYFKVSNFYSTDNDYLFYIKTTPSAVSGVKLTRPKSKAVKVSYSKNSLAKQYQIYRKKGSGKWYLVKTTTSLSWTNTKLSKGKTYYYKVRAVNGAYTGSFSSTKKIKVR